VCARQHTDAGNGKIRAPGLQHGEDETIVATDVEHAGGGRHKLGKPFRKVSTLLLKTSFSCKTPIALIEYAVYNAAR
jgi:hypothetical protein